MKKVAAAVLGLNLSLFAFSSTSLSVLNGTFDGNSAIFDTADGEKKTTLTLETLTKGSVGDVFFFVDFAKANGGQLYNSSNKAWVYGEVAPRLSLSYLTGKKLGNSFVKDYFIATQYNFGGNSDFEAQLYGLGADLVVPGFDFFQANLYYRAVDLTIGSKDYSRSTYQITTVYGTHFGDTGISFKGFIDLTGYNIGTQNQLLYEVTKIEGKPVHIGFEHLYYNESKNDFTNDDPHVQSNSLQAMVKFTW
jgi:nucleoside-specific outer membrane channel protein Tsx